MSRFPANAAALAAILLTVGTFASIVTTPSQSKSPLETGQVA